VSNQRGRAERIFSLQVWIAPRTNRPSRPAPRGAGLSMLLGAQELSELEDIDATVGAGGILKKVVGNIEILVSFRQNVPRSAELVAEIAGTRGAWITTQQTSGQAAGLHTGVGSRVRGREFIIHPDEIKRLDVGEAAVIVPRRGLAKIVRILHPSELWGKDRGC
jgi:type IV secretory pathway TraG/TraD family ATPase VirD4